MSAPMTGTMSQTRPRMKVTKTFEALPWQVAPWRDKSRVLLLTGSAGGGKSHLMLEKVNAFCLKYPGAFALLTRKVKVSMTSGTALFFESEVAMTQAESIFGGAVHLPSKSRFEYSNGSMAVYLGLEDRKQLERLKSIGRRGGVDIVAMEEATEFEERDFNGVLARMRGKAAPWRQIMLACNPDAPTHWINTRLILGGEAKVYYSRADDNPYNPDDYIDTLNSLTGVDGLRLRKGLWVQATGLVYDVWSDGPETGNVTESADYIPGAGPIYWAVDDGYTGEIDHQTKTYTGNSHPRVFLLCQLRPNGQLCVFEEHYAVKVMEETQIADVLELGYPKPVFAAVDSSAAQLRGRLHAAGVPTQRATHHVEEGVKELRGWMGADKNGVRRALVHPRCRHLRHEMVSYRNGDDGKPVKQFDHGPDAFRYLVWRLRHQR